MLQALSLVAGLLDYARHPQRHRTNQAWKDTAATLSAEERREVSRAVRGGTAVSDPSLAGPAIEMAIAVTRRPPPTWLGRMAIALFAAWLILPVLVQAQRGRWVATAVLSLPILLIAVTRVFVLRFRKRAELSLAANRAVPQPPRPRQHRVVTGPDLAFGLPRSVAQGRDAWAQDPAPSVYSGRTVGRDSVAAFGCRRWSRGHGTVLSTCSGVG